MKVKFQLVNGDYPGDRAKYKNTAWSEDLQCYVGNYDGTLLPEHSELTASDKETQKTRNSRLPASEFIALFSFEQWTLALKVTGHDDFLAAITSYTGEVRLKSSAVVAFIDTCNTDGIINDKQTKRIKRGVK